MSEQHICVITPEVKTYTLKSITWGQHVAGVIAGYSWGELTKMGASRRSFKLWRAMRNKEATRSRRRRNYWSNIAKRHIRSIDMDGR